MRVERLWEIIIRQREQLVAAWSAVEDNPEVKGLPNPRAAYLSIYHLSDVLNELTRLGASDQSIDVHACSSATQPGITRRKQGHPSSMLLEKTRVLHHVLADCVRKNLLNVDIRNLLHSLAEV